MGEINYLSYIGSNMEFEMERANQLSDTTEWSLKDENKVQIPAACSIQRTLDETQFERRYHYARLENYIKCETITFHTLLSV